jgi:phage tail-like protein
MGGVIGTPRVWRAKWKFVVEIDSVVCAAFSKCDGLSVEVAVTEHYEGGAMIPDKSPGKAKFEDLTLERGACQDLDMYNWFLEVANAAAGTGEVDPAYKRNLDIVQQERDGSEMERWRVYNAFPRKFTPAVGGWDNNSDENRIEQAVLAYDRFERVT